MNGKGEHLFQITFHQAFVDKYDFSFGNAFFKRNTGHFAVRFARMDVILNAFCPIIQNL